MNSLKLHKRQKIALCGVFSLGLITMVISLARFIVYTVTDYNVDDATGSTSPSPLILTVLCLTSARPFMYSRDVYSSRRCVLTRLETLAYPPLAKQLLLPA